MVQSIPAACSQISSDCCAGNQIAEAMPRRLAGVGHGVDEMSHIKSPMKRAAKAAPVEVHGDDIYLRFGFIQGQIVPHLAIINFDW